MHRELVLIAHNLRSTHNVGSLLRTADGLGVIKVYLTGYTPYPAMDGDRRLPHLAQKQERAINKSALGAQNSVAWELGDIEPVIAALKQQGYSVIALEQTATSTLLPDHQPNGKVAVVVGREVEGLEKDVLDMCDEAVEIPMLGHKESFNVSQAAAMALYHYSYCV